MEPTREEHKHRVRFGPARGIAWRSFRAEAGDARVEDAIREWALSGTLTAGEVLKPGRVTRVGAAALKSFPKRPAPEALLRVDPALREARLAFSIRPVRSPDPWGVLRSPWGSLLVSEFVAGRILHEAWAESERSREALPGFLAHMHDADVFHGDPHSENMLWNGEEWVLLDLGSLRRGAHLIYRRRHALRHWARLVHDITYFHPGAEAELERLFEAYRRQRKQCAFPFEAVQQAATSLASG